MATEKKSNRTRPHQVITRLSPNEFEIYQEKLKQSNMSANSFCMKCLLNKPVNQVAYEEVLALTAIQKQLSAVGNNLNQIAKHCHTEGITPSTIILENIRKELTQAWQWLRQVREVGH